jgi:hypothetical protein
LGDSRGCSAPPVPSDPAAAHNLPMALRFGLLLPPISLPP